MSRLAAIFTSLSILSLLAITGCEKVLTMQNIETANRQQDAAQKRPRRVDSGEEGLTMKEVEAVLGLPQKVHQGKVQREVLKEFAFATWTYEQDGKTIELSFIDGKLQGKVPGFGEKLDPQAPLHRKDGAGRIGGLPKERLPSDAQLTAGSGDTAETTPSTKEDR